MLDILKLASGDPQNWPYRPEGVTATYESSPVSGLTVRVDGLPGGRVISLRAGFGLYSLPRITAIGRTPIVSDVTAWEIGTWCDADQEVRVTGWVPTVICEQVIDQLANGEDFASVTEELGLSLS